GEDVPERWPRCAAAPSLIEDADVWLPDLAFGLALPVPDPLRIGRPGRGFPWSWSVTPWLAGQSATIMPPADPAITAVELGAFVRALHQPAAHDAPRNPVRGVPLADRSEAVTERVLQLEGIL